jgi:hypothetical protein
MMILSAAISMYPDVTGIYTSMVNQKNQKIQKNPTHSPWLKSEYHRDIYNKNIDGGSDGEEKLHHSR